MKHLTLDPTRPQPPTRDLPHNATVPDSLPAAKETKGHPKHGRAAGGGGGGGDKRARLLFVGTATTVLYVVRLFLGLRLLVVVFGVDVAGCGGGGGSGTWGGSWRGSGDGEDWCDYKVFSLTFEIREWEGVRLMTDPVCHVPILVPMSIPMSIPIPIPSLS